MPKKTFKKIMIACTVAILAIAVPVIATSTKGPILLSVFTAYAIITAVIMWAVYQYHKGNIS